ncbi:MAG: hypothetical protein JWL81_547, partial [Verrucomicrobiales bacterium]|nr:hypothetical protein [Verrucomicrobiales bacterium]
LKASNSGVLDQFGYSGSVSGDTVVVGAYWEDSAATGVNDNQADTAPSAGAAYVFAGVGAASFSPLEQWRQFRFGTTANSGTAADGFDFDGDGLVNLLEWAAGSHPKQPITHQPALVQNGSGWEFSYRRSLAAFNAGTGYTVEWSGTLAAGSWQTIWVTPRVVSTVGDVQTVRATVPAGLGRRYLRLRVTPP